MADFFIGLGMFIAFVLVFGFLQNWLAKIGKVNIVSKSGTIIASPKAYDEQIESLKKIKEKTIDTFKSSISSFKRFSNKSLNAAEKIRLLKELEELKSKNIVSAEEYYILRKDILN